MGRNAGFDLSSIAGNGETFTSAELTKAMVGVYRTLVGDAPLRTRAPMEVFVADRPVSWREAAEAHKAAFLSSVTALSGHHEDLMMREWGLDPDGPPKGLSAKPAEFREHEAAPTDFIAALYRPYRSPI